MGSGKIIGTSGLLQALDVRPQLRDLYAQADALLSQQALFGVTVLKEGLERLVILFQVDHPGLLTRVVFHVYVDAALADVRIKLSDFVAKRFLVDHRCLLWAKGPGLAGRAPAEHWGV
jgi:hypothetical protein